MDLAMAQDLDTVAATSVITAALPIMAGRI
jgi:hypothetical protein